MRLSLREVRLSGAGDTAFFSITNAGTGRLFGGIAADSPGITVSPAEFDGDCRVAVTYRGGSGAETASVSLITSGGEGRVRVLGDPSAVLTGTRCRSVGEFADYARSDFAGAARVFGAETFREWLQKIGFRHMDLYERFRRGGAEGLDSFLVTSGFKERAAVAPTERLLRFEFNPGETDSATGVIPLRLNGWGVASDKLTADAPWLKLLEPVVSPSDFSKDGFAEKRFIIYPGLLKSRFAAARVNLSDGSGVTIMAARRRSLSARTDRETYAPGESGSIIVVNSTRRDMLVEAAPRDRLTRFSARRYLIADKAGIPFTVAPELGRKTTEAEAAVDLITPAGVTRVAVSIKLKSPIPPDTLDTIERDISAGLLESARLQLKSAAKRDRRLRKTAPEEWARYVYLRCRAAADGGSMFTARREAGRLARSSESSYAGMAAFTAFGAARGFAALAEAFALGERSRRLLDCACDCLCAADPDTDISGAPGRSLFLGAVAWGAAKGRDISRAVRMYGAAIAARMTPAAADSVYRRYPERSLLAALCSSALTRADYSERAYRYYVTALNAGLSIPGLSAAVITSARRRAVPDVPPAALREYAEGADDAFVFHLMLTRPENQQAVGPLTRRIAEFAERSLTAGETGRYFLSAYAFYLDVADRSSPLYKKAERLVRDNLFRFRLSPADQSARQVRVFDPLMAAPENYSFSGTSCVAEAAGHGFSAAFLDGAGAAAGGGFTAVRMIENAGIRLYTRFFLDGNPSPRLLAALSKGIIDDDPRTRGISAANKLSMLTKALREPSLSPELLRAVSAAAAGLLAKTGLTAEAAERYAGTDARSVPAVFAAPIAAALAAAGDMERLAKLLASKSPAIDDETKFAAARAVAGSGSAADRAVIGPVCRELTLGGWYDAGVAKAAAGSAGSVADMARLAEAAIRAGGGSAALDREILDSAALTRDMSGAAQAAFAREAPRAAKSAHVRAYAAALCRGIELDGLEPALEAVAALEGLCLSGADPEDTTVFALCAVYARGVKPSGEVVARAAATAEKLGVIPPALETIKDKSARTPYIEENQPLEHRGRRGRNVSLVYSAGGPERGVPAKYVRFGVYAANIRAFHGDRIRYRFVERGAGGETETASRTLAVAKAELGLGEGGWQAVNDAAVHLARGREELAERSAEKALSPVPRARAILL